MQKYLVEGYTIAMKRAWCCHGSWIFWLIVIA